MARAPFLFPLLLCVFALLHKGLLYSIKLIPRFSEKLLGPRPLRADRSLGRLLRRLFLFENAFRGDF